MTIDKKIIKVVNETISEYDFLGMNKLKEQQQYYELIENEDFQKQFITDFMLGKTDKYKIVNTSDAKISGDYTDDYMQDQTNHINIEYGVRIEYKYDSNKEPVQFELYFDNDERINISIGGKEDSINTDRGTQHITDSWITYVEWDKINVNLYSIEGDEIEFKALKKAPQNIKELFVREFTKDLIESETTMEVIER